jgi:hypothetical protein
VWYFALLFLFFILYLALVGLLAGVMGIENQLLVFLIPGIIIAFLWFSVDRKIESKYETKIQ